MADAAGVKSATSSEPSPGGPSMTDDTVLVPQRCTPSPAPQNHPCGVPATGTMPPRRVPRPMTTRFLPTSLDPRNRGAQVGNDVVTCQIARSPFGSVSTRSVTYVAPPYTKRSPTEPPTWDAVTKQRDEIGVPIFVSHAPSYCQPLPWSEPLGGVVLKVGSPVEAKSTARAGATPESRPNSSRSIGRFFMSEPRLSGPKSYVK